MFSKKAELTTQQIVLLVILIASFAVILFFLFRLELGEETRKQICHNSVLQTSRGIIAEAATGFTNLDCRTNYACISSGGTCENISPSQTYDVDSNNQEEVFDALTSEMADCWWQFGEGEIDYSGWEFLDHNTCAVCSIVSVDEGVKNSLQESMVEDLYFHMATKTKEGSQTYLQYLTGENTFPRFEDYYQTSLDFSEPHVIVTRLLDTGVIGDGVELFPPVIMKQSQIGSLECDNFITKA